MIFGNAQPTDPRVRCTHAGDYWAGMKKPLAELIERNSLTADSFTLQLLGGGSRVPRTRAELLSTLPNLTLEKQLDADEAVALGAGLYAANKSTMFRLRPFGMMDGQVFPVKIVLGDGGAGGLPEHALVRRCWYSDSRFRF